MINYLGVGGQGRAGEDWPQSLSRKWGKDTKTITTICHAYTQRERERKGEEVQPHGHARFIKYPLAFATEPSTGTLAEPPTQQAGTTHSRS